MQNYEDETGFSPSSYSGIRVIESVEGYCRNTLRARFIKITVPRELHRNNASGSQHGLQSHWGDSRSLRHVTHVEDRAKGSGDGVPAAYSQVLRSDVSVVEINERIAKVGEKHVILDE